MKATPNFSKSADGLLPVIVQDWKSGEILMQAYINQEAWEKTLSTGLGTYWSRSRQELWVKGLTSGHLQHIKQILLDCDLDSIIFKVVSDGDVACHKGYRSCFFREVGPDGELRHLPEYPEK